MNYLLDTHVFLWTLLHTDRLSKQVYKILEDSRNTIFLSSISLWEIAIKYQLKKLDLGNISVLHLPNIANQSNFTIINPTAYDYITVSSLPLKENHRDPFDRMLIHTAIRNNYILLSKDKYFFQYQEHGLQLFW